LWLALSVFVFIAAESARAIICLSSRSAKTSSNAIAYSAIGIAVANFAIDTHYAHPIPHGGISLHWAMHSDISTAEQALSPFCSVILSVITMAISTVSHRALVDLGTTREASKDQ
jgi:hypothetical protein